MLAHDGLDGVAGLAGIVKRNRRNVVVQDVGLDDVVENVLANEAKLAVNGCGGTTGEVPGVRLVVGKGGVGVLKEGDGNYSG